MDFELLWMTSEFLVAVAEFGVRDLQHGCETRNCSKVITLIFHE